MPPAPRSRPARVLAGAGTVAAAGAGALLAWGALVGARRLRVREEDVTVEAPRAPALRLALLADLHITRLGRVHRDAARAVNAFRPHVVALAGDLVHRRRGLPALDAFLGLLDEGPALVAVPGNWDHTAGVVPGGLARVLHGHGGTLLVNDALRLGVDGRSVLVSGLDDAVEGRPDLPAALAAETPPDLHVLVVHAPGWRDRMGPALRELARRRGDATARALRPHLLLAGHTHGGQVTLGPLTWTPKGSADYMRGWYREGPVAMFVSQGVGTVVPVRVGSSPEVALFRIGPARPPSTPAPPGPASTGRAPA